MPTPAAPVAPAAPAAPAAQTPSAAPVKANPVVPSKIPSHSAPADKGATPKPEGTTPPPAAPVKFKRKEKIDGQEVELEADEDALWAAYRKERTVNQRFEQVAQQRKEIEAERQRVQDMYSELNDPTGEKLLALYMKQNPNADPVEVLSSILQKRLAEEEQLNDPNIRERRRLEAENKTFKEREAAQKREAQLARFEQEKQVALNELATTFGEALQLTKLPQSDTVMTLMAKAEHTNRQNGWKLTPQQLAKATEKEVHGLIEAIVGNPNATDDQVLDAFPALTKRIHKAIVARYKARQSAGQQLTPSDLTPRAKQPSAEEPPKQRVVNSKEEHEAYNLGRRSLRTI